MRMKCREHIKKNVKSSVCDKTLGKSDTTHTINNHIQLNILGGFFHVDVVDAHASTTNDAHLLCSLNDRGSDLKERNGGK